MMQSVTISGKPSYIYRPVGMRGARMEGMGAARWDVTERVVAGRWIAGEDGSREMGCVGEDGSREVGCGWYECGDECGAAVLRREWN